MSLVAIAFSLNAAFAGVSTLVAAEVIKAGDRVTAANSEFAEGGQPESDVALLGREVRRTVYVGQPITEDNTRAAMLVKRNQVVSLRYVSGALEITTSGRAMGEAGLNETVTVLNQESRQLVQGTVQESGWVLAQ